MNGHWLREEPVAVFFGGGQVKYLKSDQTEEGVRTQIYQATLLNKEFAFPLQVVIILKTNLVTQAQARVVLFSTDLELSYEKIIDYFTLRFRVKGAVTSQIEFNFRDAKQYSGLDDFTLFRHPYGMNNEQTAVRILPPYPSS